MPVTTGRHQPFDLAVFQNDESDPRSKPVSGRGPSRREAPGQIGLIEFDDREIVALGIHDSWSRPGAHHGPRIEAGDLARTEQLQGDAITQAGIAVEPHRIGNVTRGSEPGVPSTRAISAPTPVLSHGR